VVLDDGIILCALRIGQDGLDLSISGRGDRTGIDGEVSGGFQENTCRIKISVKIKFPYYNEWP
jgi:hypothetical protein